MKIVNVFVILLSCMLFLGGCSGLVRTQKYGSVKAEWYINSDNKDSKMLRGSAKDYITANSDNYILKFTDYEGNLVPEKDLKMIKSSKKRWSRNFTQEEYEERYKKPVYSREEQLKRKELRLGYCVFSDDKTPFTFKELNDITFIEEKEDVFAPYAKNSDVRKYFKEVAKQRDVESVHFCPFETRAETTKEYLEIKNNPNWTYPSNWEDDDTKFYYEKNEKGEYVKVIHLDNLTPSIPRNYYVAIRECYNDGFCKLYEEKGESVLYVKKAGLLDMSGLENVLNNYIEKNNAKNYK